MKIRKEKILKDKTIVDYDLDGNERIRIVWGSTPDTKKLLSIENKLGKRNDKSKSKLDKQPRKRG